MPSGRPFAAGEALLLRGGFRAGVRLPLLRDDDAAAASLLRDDDAAAASLVPAPPRGPRGDADLGRVLAAPPAGRATGLRDGGRIEAIARSPPGRLFAALPLSKGRTDGTVLAWSAWISIVSQSEFRNIEQSNGTFCLLNLGRCTTPPVPRCGPLAVRGSRGGGAPYRGL